MKTYFEYFLDEIQKKLGMGEIDEERAKEWIEEFKTKISEAAKIDPHHPAVQMPMGH